MMKVYFIQAGQFIKIGVSGDENKRLRSLRTGCPYPLRLLAAVECVRAFLQEKLLHQVCAQDWVRGEWFKSSPNVLFWMQRLIESHGKLFSLEDDQAQDDEWHELTLRRLRLEHRSIERMAA